MRERKGRRGQVAVDRALLRSSLSGLRHLSGYLVSTQLVPTQLANHCIRANLGIRVSAQILVSGQTNWRKLPDRFGRPPPILSGYLGISRQPGRCNLSIPRYYRPPSVRCYPSHRQDKPPRWICSSMIPSVVHWQLPQRQLPFAMARDQRTVRDHVHTAAMRALQRRSAIRATPRRDRPTVYP